jgi:hypothetical protein
VPSSPTELQREIVERLCSESAVVVVPSVGAASDC